MCVLIILIILINKFVIQKHYHICIFILHFKAKLQIFDNIAPTNGNVLVLQSLHFVRTLWDLRDKIYIKCAG